MGSFMAFPYEETTIMRLSINGITVEKTRRTQEIAV